METDTRVSEEMFALVKRAGVVVHGDHATARDELLDRIASLEADRDKWKRIAEGQG